MIQFNYNTVEQISHAVSRDDWTKEQFKEALTKAGTSEAPALVTRSDEVILREAALVLFEITESEFNELYGSGETLS